MKALTIGLTVLALAALTTFALAETEIKKAPISWEQAALSDGEALYVELCAVCHGVSGMGDGPAAPALSGKLSDLTKLSAQNGGEFPSAEVEAAITGSKSVTAHGTAEMPVWGRVFEDVRPDRKPAQRWTFARSRIYNLTEYIKTLQVE